MCSVCVVLSAKVSVSCTFSLHKLSSMVAHYTLKMCYGIAPLCTVQFIMFYFGIFKLLIRKQRFFSEFQFSSFTINDTSINTLLKSYNKY